MATVDGTSLCTQVEDHKVRLKALHRQGKLTPEAALFIDGIMLLMELMVTVLPERTTKKTSANSSLPRSGSDGTAQLQGTVPEDLRQRQPAPEEHHPDVTGERVFGLRALHGLHRGLRPRDADLGGHRLRGRHHPRRGRDQDLSRLRQGDPRWLPRHHARPAPVRTRHHRLRHPPDGRPHGTPQARRANPQGAHRTRRRRGHRCERLARALEDRERAAITYVLAGPVLHVDETSIRINGKNHWLHDDGTGDITLVFRHPNRGRTAMNDISIIPRYGGALIHDRWSSHLSFGHCGQALCGAHLERNLRFIVDSNNHRWAQHMLALLNQTARKVGKSPDRALRGKDFKALRKRYRTILTKGRRELPPAAH